MDLFSLRTSVRSFTEEKISPELVKELLLAAVEAPSAGNCQPWHFYAVENTDLKQKLCACAYNQKFIEAAPLIIVVCAVPSRSEGRYEERGTQLYCIQDTAAAIENILLCAVQHGLGSCWVGAFDEAEVSEALSLPSIHRPVALLPIGHPMSINKKRARRPMEETVTYMG